MSSLINETGNRYGRLLVLGPGEVRRTTKMWRCLCDCGNNHIATGGNEPGQAGSVYQILELAAKAAAEIGKAMP